MQVMTNFEFACSDDDGNPMTHDDIHSAIAMFVRQHPQQSFPTHVHIPETMWASIRTWTNGAIKLEDRPKTFFHLLPMWKAKKFALSIGPDLDGDTAEKNTECRLQTAVLRGPVTAGTNIACRDVCISLQEPYDVTIGELTGEMAVMDTFVSHCACRHDVSGLVIEGVTASGRRRKWKLTGFAFSGIRTTRNKTTVSATNLTGTCSRWPEERSAADVGDGVD